VSACCLLCGATEPRRVASIDARVLAHEYRRVFGIDPRFPEPLLHLVRCDRCDLAFFTPPCPGDEAFYQALQHLPWYYQDDKPEYRFAAAHVTAADAVLEVGGGGGAFADHLGCRSYRMLELNRAAIDLARRRGLDAREDTVQDHALEHPEAFDVVCAFQVLEHVPDPREFVEASVACLRPGGRLILSVPGDESFVGRERHNLMNLPPHHVTRWSDRSLTGLGALLGLDVAALHHDVLAPWHTLPYASHLADRLLAAVLRRRWQPLDPVLVAPPARAARAALRLAPYPLVRLRRAAIRGHSTTIVYRKPDREPAGDRQV
jgi:SAM-dependent methyltransferase